jgi:hypothetical protein
MEGNIPIRSKFKKLELVLIIVLSFSFFSSSCSSEKKSDTNEVKGSNVKISTNDEGVKIYKNSSKGKVADLTLNPIESFKIIGDPELDENLDSARFFGSASDLDFDSEGNLYILDMPRCKVKKFDKDGNFLASFGNRGTGPGEFVLPNALAVLKDTIFVADINARKFSKFNTNGEFIEFTNVTGEMPQYLFSTKADNFISLVNKYQRVDDDMYLSFYLGLFDTKFDSVLAFKGGRRQKLDRDGSFNLLDFYLPYTWSPKNERIYVARNSEDRYQIDEYDYSGKHISTINKNYIKVKFNAGELDDFNTWSQRFYPPTSAVYKKAINTMYFDKYDRLWVAKSIKRDETNKDDLFLDIFKDGEFLNTVKIDICNGFDYYNEGYQLFFENERIYLLDLNNAEIVAYDY